MFEFVARITSYQLHSHNFSTLHIIKYNSLKQNGACRKVQYLNVKMRVNRYSGGRHFKALSDSDIASVVVVSIHNN